MSVSASRRGIARERQVKEWLIKRDWWVCRAAGSFGDADLVALRDGCTPRLIEVKSSAAGPYHSFGPKARADLSAAARLAGCSAWLAWYPPRGELRWIPESEWPS